MLYRLIADILFLVHFAFILFVIFGGFLSRRWPKAAGVHLPVAAYGVGISVVGWTCPLTPLEWHFRWHAGAEGLEGGWIDHYIVPLIYPAGLTPGIQLGLAIGLVGLTLLAYWPFLKRRGAA
ncbi:MAG: DUF2784 domain-containing protein [Bradymonadaceae bacterium]|nr:DUF2784 domain-containing protein [Lujinxingiaceae bacterium]